MRDKSGGFSLGQGIDAPAKKVFSSRRVVLVLTGFWAVQVLISAAAQIYIAALYGTGVALDSYLVGIAIPNTAFLVLGSGLGVAVIGFFNETRIRSGESAALGKITVLCGWTVLVSAVLSGVLVVAAADVVDLIGPGLSEQARFAAGRVLRLTAYTVPFLAVSTIVQGLLQANQKYYICSVGAILQVGLLPIFLLLGGSRTPETLGWGFTAGAIIGCGVLIVSALRAGLLLPGRLSRPDWGSLVRIGLPLMCAGLLTHFVWVFERYLASQNGPGAISALGYAQRLVNLLAGGLTFGLSTVLVPLLSRRLSDRQYESAVRVNRKALSWVLPLSIGVIGLVLVLATPIVRIILQRGHFTGASTEMTSLAFRMYSGVLLNYLVGAVVIRGAMAAKKGRLMVLASVVLVAVYLTLTPRLQKSLGFGGVPLGASVAFSTSLLVYVVGLARGRSYLFRPEGWTGDGAKSEMVVGQVPKNLTSDPGQTE
jgi:putative peptidoglycan lipid II flippase